MIQAIYNPNLVALAVNIGRVYEISKVGGHSVKIIASETGNVSNEDIVLLSSFYSFHETDNPDIIVELAYDSQDILNCFNKQYRGETIEDIKSRIRGKELTHNRDTDKTSLPLLKTAIGRLNLGINDVLIIHALANTIAHIDGSGIIKCEHMAEAISYRSIKPKPINN